MQGPAGGRLSPGGLAGPALAFASWFGSDLRPQANWESTTGRRISARKKRRVIHNPARALRDRNDGAAVRTPDGVARCAERGPGGHLARWQCLVRSGAVMAFLFHPGAVANLAANGLR